MNRILIVYNNISIVRGDKIVKSIIELASELVKIPSQAVIDNNDNIIEFIYNWSLKNDLNVKYLYDKNDKKSAILIQNVGSNSGKNHYCFNACADTAPFGDVSKWMYHPSSGKIIDGYMYGRGSADSKIAISIFLHIAKELKKLKSLNGQVDFVFDADEHTGNFSGIKSYLEYLNYKKIDGVCIGYP
ncbi:MAG: M20/M25/M40 family metallo-hydrolase, partial [Clostridiales bacterium]